MHFSLLLKGLPYESRLWEGCKVLLILFQRTSHTIFFLSFFYLNDVRNREKHPLDFYPMRSVVPLLHLKKITSVVPFPPSTIFRIHLGTSCIVTAIIPGFKHCLSKGRGYAKIFTTSLCLLFALKVSTCARKNTLSMLYMERSWANKAAWQRNDEFTKEYIDAAGYYAVKHYGFMCF